MKIPKAMRNHRRAAARSPGSRSRPLHRADQTRQRRRLNPDPANLRAPYAILDDRERPYYEHRMAA